MAGNVSSDKAALRTEAESRRRALSPEVVQRWGGEVQRHLAALPLFSDRLVRTVAVYDAQAFEVPLADLVLELSARGMRCVYPRVARGSRQLSFHHVNDDWTRGPFGIREPAPHSRSIPVQDIDVFLVPGVAFTRDGRRLGRGGGYYDATLALRGPQAHTVGIAFGCNVVADIPTEAHDVRVDYLATEVEAFSTAARR